MFPNVTSIILGGALSALICEVMRMMFRFQRFNMLYTITFIPLSIILPSIVYMNAFPYYGALAGITYVFTLIGSIVGAVGYVTVLSACMIRNTEIKRRFFYCTIAFVMIGIMSVYLVSGVIPHPQIE